MTSDPQTTRPEGLFGSVRQFGRNLLGAFQTRLEILGADIAEVRMNLVRAALVVLGVLFCFQMAIILGVLFFVLAVGSDNRLQAIGIAAVVLLLAALVGGLWLWRWLKSQPPMFEGTIAELRKDRQRFGGDR